MFHNTDIKVATDIICLAEQDDKLFVLLILREYEPFRECWALPGGFLNKNEELETCAIRELKEETNIDAEIKDIKFINVFGNIGRDPRNRVISLAYLAKLNELAEVSIANESLKVEWIDVKEILNNKVNLAFDHLEILKQGIIEYSK